MHFWISAHVQTQAALVAVQPSDPFFTNDIEGALKVGGMILAIVSAFWVMLKGKLQQDINGVGERVKKLEEAEVSHDARVDLLDNQVRDLTTNYANMRETVGEMRRAQEAISDQMHEMQVSIVGEIQKTRDTVRREMSAVRERVVVLETVARIEQSLGRKLTEVVRGD